MDSHAALVGLAARAGVETSYLGWRGEPVHAATDALCAVLRALGHEVRGPDDAAAALAAAERAHWQAGAPPVVVAWDADEVRLPLRVPAEDDADWEVELTTEDGRRERRTGRLYDLPARDHAWPDALGARVWCERDVALPAAPHGYHAIAWRVGTTHGTAHVIAAPRRAWGAPGEGARRWGVFAPLYAARDASTGGAGDLGTLADLRARIGARGGAYVATLPLLAAFLDEPCNTSPYGPASRLYWNELYLALDETSPAWRAAASERASLAAAPRVEYRRQYAWRRAAIDAEAARAWADPARAAALAAFAAEGRVADYAVFRAIGERERAPWSAWPAALRDGAPVVSSMSDVPAEHLGRARAHVFAQHAMDAQLAAQARTAGHAGLYLDLPVGVGADAYEVWRDRALFAVDAAAGAPPDALFLGGQDWGLPPVAPAASRETGHAYLAACVRHHMRHASMLRIDHAMGLWRLYWVPRGFGAKDGVYVRYPADELCAILALESHRHRCAIAGEDLGTVPDYVRPAMARHGFFRLHVGQFAMPSAPGDAPAPAPAESIASLNTHDTATFGGWWLGRDCDDRRALGLIDDARAAAEHAERRVSRAALLEHVDRHGLAPHTLPDPARALHGAQAELAAGPAEVVLVTVEDLWLEPEPQNVPGTTPAERPNWQRPFAESLTALDDDPVARVALDAVADRRRT
jgi:4-alpha-glucanotransferase